jgi:hypothetical protein
MGERGHDVDRFSDDELANIEERVCGTKRRLHRREARTVAQRFRHHGHRVSPYRCPFCGSWHVGHVPSMTTVAQIAQAIRQRAYPPAA